MGVKSSSAKLVLLILADCHNGDNGRCDPSVPFISKFTGLNKKTVSSALANLQRAGLITAELRPGTSSQYSLHISDFPAPTRAKGERRKTLPIHTPPKIGGTQNVPGTPPKIGGEPPPISGGKPTMNLQGITCNSSDPAGSAAGASNPVDNFAALGVDYQHPSADQVLFNRGAAFLETYGINNQSARSFLGECKKKHGLGRTLDTLVVAICSQPSECPKAFIKGCLKPERIPRVIDQTWAPDAAMQASLEAMGVWKSLLQNSSDVFVIWFSEMEIKHTDWPRLFRDWVTRDFERAEMNAHQYRVNLAASAGLTYQTPWTEPAGGTL